ncbi:MAG: tRNA (adenosine(37)-N6)-threonylcarbamoyltransferase complex transferase subunit TsaD [Candidatus Wolfebacteria bacterium]|nr:tRNA (adenosine(37)-N6)-threonylcarbamoyltransferase complex transferase subunit TsaD [Candidatus Wolfebacteria bacterium]
MKILAIETSCDETAIALVEASGGLPRPRFKILENLVASQIKIHAPFGGVVPNLAKREHLKNLPLLWQRIMNNELGIRNKKSASKTITHNSKFIIPKIDLICVTVGPGLEPALWTGIEFSKELYSKLKTQNPKLKLIGVSHLSGHLYSFLLPSDKESLKSYGLNLKSLFPAIALIVSGGHTSLLLMKSLTSIKKIGETRDDAVGESFDKVARLLGLPYPGGPQIEKISKDGNPLAIEFPRPMIHQKNFDFSYSGLKTSVLYYLRDNKDADMADVAASFRQAAFDVLIKKTFRAAREFKARSIMVSGGVSASRELRKRFNKETKKSAKIKLLIPDLGFSTDNAAMIAAAGYINFLRKKNHKLEANGNLQI